MHELWRGLLAGHAALARTEPARLAARDADLAARRLAAATVEEGHPGPAAGGAGGAGGGAAAEARRHEEHVRQLRAGAAFR